MSLSPVVNLYFDTTQYGNYNRQLLQSLLSSKLLDQLGIVAEDVLTLNLWPRATSGIIGASTTTVQLANPGELFFSMKAIGALNATTLLASASGFSEEQDGNGNYYYTATLSLQTSQLIAALGDETYLPVLLELENVGTGLQRFQFPANVYPAVYSGSETLPTSALPSIWNASQSDARYIRADSGLFGSVALGSGVSSYSVTGLALPFTPAAVLTWIMRNPQGAGFNIFSLVDQSTITTAGFTTSLSSATDDTACVLCWLCLPSPGSYTNGNPAVPPTAQNVVVTTAAATVNLAIPGLIQLNVTAATGTVALTLNNPVTGAPYVFKVVQGSTPLGITFPSPTKQKGGGGATYTPSGANAIDVIKMVFDGTNYLIELEAAYA